MCINSKIIITEACRFSDCYINKYITRTFKNWLYEENVINTTLIIRDQNDTKIVTKDT